MKLDCKNWEDTRELIEKVRVHNETDHGRLMRSTRKFTMQLVPQAKH